jgi:adenine-specific DNA-methyltransferase
MPTLHFKGKTFVQNHHLAVKYHQLVPKKELSLTDPALGGTGAVSLHDNLIIQGDNLKALKALLPTYAGKIKCIYIDPPYNTGNENWVYNDNVNSPMIKDWLGKVVDKEDMTRHDKWLCLMMPRLKLLRELLSEDGVIFISIDEIEHHYLETLMDEIFGKDNFLCNFIWKSRQIVDSRNQNKISTDHEYVVAFAKNSETTFRGKQSDKSKYSNPDKDTRGVWMSNSILGLANAENRPNLHYSIKDPKTGRKFDCPPDTGWRYSKETMQKKIEEGRIVFPKKDDGRPREKKFLSELTDEFTGFSSILDESVGYTLHGTRDLREILGVETFAFPKPQTLIKKLIQQVTKDGDIILDSFSGSGTTAHAVLELNKEDGGNRKFILVEQEDYANTITAERVRKVIKGVPKSTNFKEGTGGTFSYFELGPSIEMESLLTGKSLPTYEELARYIFYTATGTEFSSTKINPTTHFIGETDTYELYMLYEPNIDWLKQNAVTLDWVQRMPKFSGKQRLVFAPAKYVDDETCRWNRMDFCQLPYEIYRIQK